MKELCAALVASLVLFGTTPLLAQSPTWAIGTWKGRLEQFRQGDPDRILVVVITGGKTYCQWGEGFRGTPPPAKSCSITGDTLKLTTGQGNQVELQHRGDKLVGTFSFASAGGAKPFALTMSK